MTEVYLVCTGSYADTVIVAVGATKEDCEDFIKTAFHFKPGELWIDQEPYEFINGNEFRP